MSDPNPALSANVLDITTDEIIAHVDTLKSLVESGNGRAAMELAIIYSPWSALADDVKKKLQPSLDVSEEYNKTAATLLLQEAIDGDGEAMHDLAIYYQTGRGGLERDMKLFLEWNEKSLAAGYMFAANDLYSMYSESGEYFDPQKAKAMAEILRKHKCAVVKLVPPEKPIRADG